MNGKLSTKPGQAAGSVIGLGVLLLAGCGQQAGDDYLGEPLLHMRGQATVSALTGGQAIVPALCFFGADSPEPPPFDRSKLPAAVNAPLPGGLPGQPIIAEPTATHIVDVESRGEFPAQFDIEVYLPPPDAALSVPVIDGDPRWASGNVCAVTGQHQGVTFPLATGGSSIGAADGSFHKTFVWASQASDRVYTETYDCPTGETPDQDCAKATEGDSTLKYEGWSESVLGAATDLSVVYLAEPAAAGSYAAWSVGAAAGLSAGYHLYPPAPQAALDAQQQCFSSVWPDALVEIKAQYEAQIKRDYGDFQVLDMFPSINTPDGASLQRVPDDVYRGGMGIIARMSMERCEMIPRTEIDAGTPTLSIEIDQAD